MFCVIYTVVDSISAHSFGVHEHFLCKLYILLYNKISQQNDFSLFKTKNNGIFLYFYLPFYFKNYHNDETLPNFIYEIQSKNFTLNPCYKYLIRLYDELIGRIMEEKKEFEYNEETVSVLLFLWSIIKKEGKKEKEIECLINMTLKVFEHLGRIEEGKLKENEENEERKKEILKNVTEGLNHLSGELNRKEFLMFMLYLTSIHYLNNNSNEDGNKIKKDGRIRKSLIEIIKNHLKKEEYLIEKGDKKKIMEYILYSFDRNSTTAYLISPTSHSYPFSNFTLCFFLGFSGIFFSNDDYIELIKKDLFSILVEILNNFEKLINFVDVFDIKKEIETDLCVELNDEVIDNIKEKVYLNWKGVSSTIPVYFLFKNLSTFDEENNNIIKRLLFLFFSHSSNYKSYECKEEKENEKEMKTIKTFKINEREKRDFLDFFVPVFFSSNYYSIFDVNYLINKSEGCDLIGIYLKELSGEIVDRMKKKEGTNIIKERRKYERERNDDAKGVILKSLKDIFGYTFKSRKNIYLGKKRMISILLKVDEGTKARNDISDVIEEEDVKECLLLFTRHLKSSTNLKNPNIAFRLSTLYENSIDALICLLCSNVEATFSKEDLFTQLFTLYCFDMLLGKR